METFSFSSSAKKHQVFGILNKAVKLCPYSLDFVAEQRGKRAGPRAGTGERCELVGEGRGRGAALLAARFAVPALLLGLPCMEESVSLILLQKQSVLWMGSPSTLTGSLRNLLFPVH